MSPWEEERYSQHEMRHESECVADEEHEEQYWQRVDMDSMEAAMSGEGDTTVEQVQEKPMTTADIARASTLAELLELRTAIDIELKRRESQVNKDAAALKLALHGVRPRRIRSDAGRPRAPKPAQQLGLVRE